MHWHHLFRDARRRFEDAHATHHAFAGRGFFGGRHGHGHSFDDFEGLRGGRGGGRFGGRMFGSGDLKLLLLALIEQQPRHGYELIRIIEDMFDGQYSPSPGAVYPTLTLLEEMGHARADADDSGKKQYAISAEGVAFLDENRDAVRALNERLQATAKTMSRMSAPMAIRKAMHALKFALLGHHRSWDAAETRRVVGVLERAAAEIERGPTK
jgi:DNA-binding PadR family transcriptional regulator